VDATIAANPNIEELIEMAKQKDRERNTARDIVDTEQHKVDKTPWLRRTEWPQIFSGKDIIALDKGQGYTERLSENQSGVALT
jgi:hypothetical protein